MISEKSITSLKNFNLVIFGLNIDLPFRKFFLSQYHRFKEGQIKPKSRIAPWDWIALISDNWKASNCKSELYKAELMVLEILFLIQIMIGIKQTLNDLENF